MTAAGDERAGPVFAAVLVASVLAALITLGLGVTNGFEAFFVGIGTYGVCLWWAVLIGRRT